MMAARTSTPSLSTPLLLLLLVLLLSSTAQAQESPSFKVAKFDSSESHRTNVCERQRAVWEGEISLPNALRGLDLTTVITNYRVADEDKYFTLVQTDENGKHNESIAPHIRRDDPGLFAVILDEVAHRAGFSWRNSFAVTSPLNTTIDGENKTWTDILKWGVDTFDLSMEKWGRSISRSELGISFPAGWWDSSIVLVESLQESKREVNLWGFLSPFKVTVWITIGATIVFTGLMYWCLEYLDVKADERDLEDKPMASIFYAALVFVGHLEFRPKTHSARILSWSWTFWAVIVGSAYTANMASFLVSPQVDVYRISSMEQAMALDADICVQGGGVLATILEQKYGKLNLVPKDSEAGIFKGLRDGSCQVAAHQMNTFRIYEKNADANPECNLNSEKRVVQPVPAGMATAIDTGTVFCTSLISHVLDYHLTKMISEGFVEKAMKMHLGKIGTIECIAAPPRGGDFGGDTFSLGLQDIGGIFILHAAVLAVAVSISLFQFYYFETSKKSLAEIFFVRQARQEIRSMRASLRNSMDSSDHNPPVLIAPSSPQQRRASRSHSLVSPFGSGALSHDLSLDGSSSMMDMSRSGGIANPLEPVLEGEREESQQFGSSSFNLEDAKMKASLRKSVNVTGEMQAILEADHPPTEDSSSHLTTTHDESLSRDDDPSELAGLDQPSRLKLQRVSREGPRSAPVDLDITLHDEDSSQGSVATPNLENDQALLLPPQLEKPPTEEPPIEEGEVQETATVTLNDGNGIQQTDSTRDGSTDQPINESLPGKAEGSAREKGDKRLRLSTQTLETQEEDASQDSSDHASESLSDDEWI
ncbi:receptor subunit 1 [Seminavis robusta]|uniref:Receptor subunit 1 n=1 Tax=Seminavis robusta TaxID=568900 RepID=A0A9N8EN60_9STRA|nr:receptor subunit 1 [Seminavis robusta]|eukprot:Sro1209_g252620.1 receptor subunit 1 (820) ;mRNA; f:3737-6304